MASQTRNRRKINYFISTCIAIITILLYFSHYQFVEKITLSFNDYKFQIRQIVGLEPQANPDLIIITVDEQSVNHLGRWPWDRKDIAVILAALKEARIVGLDMVFSEKTNTESDSELAHAITNIDNVILGYFLRSTATSENQEENIDILEECAFHNIKGARNFIGINEFSYAETNLTEYHDNALSCGFFSAESDADGLYRQYPIAYTYQGLLLPSLALQMVRFLENEEINILLDKKGIARLSIAGNTIEHNNKLRLNLTNKVKTISAYDVFSGKIAPDFFNNKIVLIGVTEIGVFDMRPTPIDATMPGVYLHYTAISNLLNQDLLHDSIYLDILLVVLIVIFISIFSTFPSMSIRLSCYVGTLVTVMLMSNLLFIQYNIWLQEIYSIFTIFLLALLLELSLFNQLGKESRELKRAFSSYVSPELVTEIIQDPHKLLLGGNEKEITVLFSDIRNFTAMSERLSPTELVTILNQLFDPLTEVVLKNKGMLDKYIGDAMMVLFNAPLDLHDHPIKAVKTGISMLRVLDDINIKLQSDGFPTVSIGIGINTGTAVVGNMGSKLRFNYTALGDAVNLAARLEGLTKYYGVKIIISEFTQREVTNSTDILMRKLDRVRVKGKEEVVTIYEVMVNNEINTTIKADFEIALELYFNQDFKKSATIFKTLYSEHQDIPSKTILARCLSYQQHPPASNWSGAETMQSK